MSEKEATPKQVAYLTFMGAVGAASLSKNEASKLINNLHENEERDYARRVQWTTERYVLYPDLYAPEFREFVGTHFLEEMHAYVRARVVGASETLTKQKIASVIDTMTVEDRLWWRNEDRTERFFEKLFEMYPGCCDGGVPRCRPKHAIPTAKQLRFSIFDYVCLKSLLDHYIEYCEPWEVSLSQGGTTATPESWLHMLDGESLTAPFTQINAGTDGTFYTIENKRPSGVVQITFSVSWNSERRGWADSGPGSKLVHCFVPPEWLGNSAGTDRRTLVSLCGKARISNCQPFYPIDAARTLCRKCGSLYEEWNSRVPS